MRAYAQYASRLDALIEDLDWGHRLPRQNEGLLHNLNGGAADALRELVGSTDISESGAFFTPKALAQNSVEETFLRIGDGNNKAMDPAFGAGDLLLRWAEMLPIHRSLENTLDNWGCLLSGFELHPEFIAVAKRRLVLLALSRGAKLEKGCAPGWNSLFPQLRQSDFITTQERPSNIAVIVMNPPFTAMPAPVGCKWAKGRVNAAAVFLEQSLVRSQGGQRIVAILPEVLRSGTRYSRWRELVAGKMSISRCDSWGRFSEHADVDVFILEGITHLGVPGGNWPKSAAESGRLVLGEMAKIAVGPVVPHRHKEVGSNVPYITAKSIPAWKSVRKIQDHRRFEGTIFKPPFVVVRRTSSPHDQSRAIGTVVGGNKSVAVENHLLVVRPISGLIKDCRRILRSLKSRSTTKWLNERIRCRHLTTTVMKELPFFES